MRVADEQLTVSPPVDPSANELAVAIGAIAAVCALLYLTAPRDGDFWWSDAPRHALNGVFYRDLLQHGGLRHPVQFAFQYYLTYPALTTILYPPLFSLVLAAAYQVFGVSHATAQLTVAVFYAFLGLGCHLLVRRWVGPSLGLATAITVLSLPEMALWGRQVMLEVPALALLVWSVFLAVRYADTGRNSLLLGGVALLLMSMYTKMTVVFMVPVLVGYICLRVGPAILRRRIVWVACILFLLGLIPLVILTLTFGQANLQSVAGVTDAQVSRLSIAGWLWYGRQLPTQVGWPVLALACCHVSIAIGRRSWRPSPPDAALWAGWFLIGYLFFSAIDLKEPRHTTVVLVPLGLFAISLFPRIVRGRRASAVLAFALAIVTLSTTLAAHPVPKVEGYARAADFVLARARRGSVVLFSGKRDGSFVFDVRARSRFGAVQILRADKLLLKVAVRRELGVTEMNYSEREIADILDEYGVSFVVAQSDFWTDLPVMARLQAVLRSDRFEEIGRLTVSANVPVEDHELRIYRNRGPIASRPVKVRIDLPIIGSSITGLVGAGRE